ncbi:MAG: TetR/AcrR family transcriptional regulator [Spongiibacteraceae bacterium]
MPLSKTQRKIYRTAMRLFTEKGRQQIAVSELADAAGIARGTVYNNIDSIDDLFTQVSAELQRVMHQHIRDCLVGIEDPALRLSMGIRLFIRRVHEEPDWGRFVQRFAYSSTSVENFMNGQAVQDLQRGITERRYSIDQDRLQGIIALIAGTTFTSMFFVSEGYRSWREASEDASFLILSSLGIAAGEITTINKHQLPTLTAKEVML